MMTSGNISEEPIVRTNIEAMERLSTLADAFLFHNREIHCVCDDSVVRVFRGHELPIRRSRGYAPMPVRLDRGGVSVLAVGGELKASFCMTEDKCANAVRYGRWILASPPGKEIYFKCASRSHFS